MELVVAERMSRVEIHIKRAAEMHKILISKANQKFEANVCFYFANNFIYYAVLEL